MTSIIIASILLLSLSIAAFVWWFIEDEKRYTKEFDEYGK